MRGCQYHAPTFALFQSDHQSSEGRIVMHMHLKFTRSPYEDHSYFAEKSYDGQMRIWRTETRDQSYGYLEIGFSTNPNGQRRSTFTAGIGPYQFGEMARLMVEADPQAAIRAFGAAIKDIEIQKREIDPSEVVAA
jgi:hypothetical protein